MANIDKCQCAALQFRLRFHELDGLVLVSLPELAQLLLTTPGGVRQMRHRGELPPPAFPKKRKCVWLVQDIRLWLSEQSRDERGGQA